jgi:crossover junction endodeoxyribonuclease RuvC
MRYDLFMTIILGIDPGSIRTGFGIINSEKNQLSHIAHGTIVAKGDTVASRLHYIHNALCEMISVHKPDEAAIETVFMQVNVQSALKLGQARGAALVALASLDIPIAEYAPRDVKKTATGYGAASKEQMQHMIKIQLKLSSAPQADAADALAIALCHAHYRTSKIAQCRKEFI